MRRRKSYFVGHKKQRPINGDNNQIRAPQSGMTRSPEQLCGSGLPQAIRLDLARRTPGWNLPVCVFFFMYAAYNISSDEFALLCTCVWLYLALGSNEC